MIVLFLLSFLFFIIIFITFFIKKKKDEIPYEWKKNVHKFRIWYREDFIPLYLDHVLTVLFLVLFFYFFTLGQVIFVIRVFLYSFLKDGGKGIDDFFSSFFKKK